MTFPQGLKKKMRKAFIAPFMVIVVMLFLSVLTLIVDGGKMVVAHSELQGLSEIVAMSAGTVFLKGDAAVRANIDRFFMLNHISDCAYTFQLNATGLTVTLTRTVPLLLSARVGFNCYKVDATSTVASYRGQVRLVP